MNIKNITSLILFLFVFTTGCQDDFLERSPIVGVTEDNFYNTGEDAIAAVNAAYAPLQFELSPAGHFRWFWGDVMSDDTDKGGSGPNDVFILSQLENFEGPTNSDLLRDEWKANFQGINRANVVLEKVPPIDMDETLKARVIGEAKFIRAWFNYNLVTVFGDIPLIDHVLAPSEFDLPRTPAEQIWDFIITDLNDAIPVLSKRSEYAAADLGRITQGAAQALLAKAYLWEEDYDGAKRATEDIISSNEYFLEADFARIFTRDGENGPGSVFEIQYMQDSGGNWGEGAANEGTFTNVFQRARGQFEGFGFNLPTQDLVDEFFAEGAEDPRLSATVFRVGDQMGDRGEFTKEATGFDHDYYCKKYFNNKSDEASFGDPNPNGGSNYRAIRYADVLLMNAEAAFKTGDETTARNSLNEVRARARGADANILPDVTASGTELLEAIYHEQRIELALEGHRFFELVRTKRASQELGGLGYTDGVHNVFPIPDSQIQATNGALTQNPGY